MPVRRPVLAVVALAASASAALAVTVPAATADPSLVPVGTPMAAQRGHDTGWAASARRAKYKKIRVGYTVTPIKGAYDYTFTVTTKKGRPVPGVRFNLQYQGGIKGQKWSNTGMKFTSDANGQFHSIGCNISFGPERMHTNATKKHSAASATFQLPAC